MYPIPLGHGKSGGFAIQNIPKYFFQQIHCLQLKIAFDSLVIVETVYFLTCKLFCWEKIVVQFVLKHEKASDEIAV